MSLTWHFNKIFLDIFTNSCHYIIFILSFFFIARLFNSHGTFHLNSHLLGYVLYFFTYNCINLYC